MSSINKKLFNEHFCILMDILNSNMKCLSEKEQNYRAYHLNRIYEKMLTCNEIIYDFYSMSHEIRAMDFFKKTGDLVVSNDSRSDAGADLTFKDKYKIECVACTPGTGKNLSTLKEKGYGKHDGKVRDYSKLNAQISLRILSALDSKSKKYTKYISDGTHDSKSPFLIFLNLGSLINSWFPLEFCKEANRVLVGMGNQVILYDSSNEHIENIIHDHVLSIENNSRAEVNMNFFNPEKNTGISAVIITTANLEDLYSKENVYIFINPYAKNRINISDFKGMRYWKANESSEYIPRINGRRQRLEGF